MTGNGSCSRSRSGWPSNHLMLWRSKFAFLASISATCHLPHTHPRLLDFSQCSLFCWSKQILAMKRWHIHHDYASRFVWECVGGSGRPNRLGSHPKLVLTICGFNVFTVPPDDRSVYDIFCCACKRMQALSLIQFKNHLKFGAMSDSVGVRLIFLCNRSAILNHRRLLNAKKKKKKRKKTSSLFNLTGRFVPRSFDPFAGR